MKSIQTIIMTCLLMIGMMVSCNNDLDVIDTHSSSSAYLKIDVLVEGMTRAAIDGTNFTKGDAIGVFVRDNNGNAYTATQSCTNIKATFDGSQWTLESNIALQSGKEASVYAYYPYNANSVIDGDSINIDITNQDDVLYGSATGVTTSNPTASITFKHALARITLSITKGDNDEGEGNLTKVRIGSYSNVVLVPGEILIGNMGFMSVKTGYIRTINEESLVIMPVSGSSKLSERETKIDFLIIPTSSFELSTKKTEVLVRSVQLFMTIDGKEYNYLIKSPEWKAGQHYVYPITINRSSSEEPTTSTTKYVNMGIKGDNSKEFFLWATYNLGASPEEDYGGYYGWGDPDGKHKEQWVSTVFEYYVSQSKGLLFYGGANPPTNIAGTDLDPVTKVLGERFRMPSMNEWNRLLSNSTINKTTKNNIEGYEITSKINNNKIFIPTKDSRLGDTYLTGFAGYYWSSTWYSSGKARAINFEKVSDNYVSELCYGHHIRPVYEASLKEYIYDFQHGNIK